MAMEHKAFVLDYKAFMDELADILYQALVTNDTSALAHFIKANLPFIRDPYEGEWLTPAWESTLECRDVNEYGDFALTKFYDPTRNIGLAYEWQETQELVGHDLGGDALMVLGEPFGPPSNCFDPGRMGTYFQAPQKVRENLERLDAVLHNKAAPQRQLSKLMLMLSEATILGHGLYVTL